MRGRPRARGWRWLFSDFSMGEIVGYAPVCCCLAKFKAGADYRSVNFFWHAEDLRIEQVSAWGDIGIEAAGEGLWKYHVRTRRLDPLEAGLLFQCGSCCICIDPVWGAVRGLESPGGHPEGTGSRSQPPGGPDRHRNGFGLFKGGTGDVPAES